MPDLSKLKNNCFSLPSGTEWTTVLSALQTLKLNCDVVSEVENISVTESMGRIIAEDIVAKRSHPPASNSAVDGYGFAGGLADGLYKFKLMEGRSAAGKPFKGILDKNHAVRILTGALIPEGVETVVMQEDVRVQGGEVFIEGMVRVGSNIRRKGEDIALGSVVLKKSQKINAQDIGFLVSVGVQEIAVYKRLRVGVLSTGDEISPIGFDVEQWQVFDANRPMLLAALTRMGYQLVDLGHVGDNEASVREALDKATSLVDVIVASGGASVGDEDYVSRLIKSEGIMHSWKIAIKPGRPLALGIWKDIPFFGLPGNPVAAFVCALIFASPALSVLSGGNWLEPATFRLSAAFSKKKRLGRREYLRARIDSNGLVNVFPSEGSGRISSLSWADGFVVFNDDEEEINNGDIVTFLPYSSFGL